MNEPIPQRHIRELAGRKSKPYELLLALEQNSSANESSFQSLAHIVDRIIFNEVPLGDQSLRDLTAWLSDPADHLTQALAVLSLAVSEAEPDRGQLQMLLEGYPGWLKAISPEARPYFLDVLPNIAGLLGELKNPGIESLIACFNRCTTPQDFETLKGCINRYKETSGEIVLAAAELAGLAIRTGAGEMLGQMMIAVPPDIMFDSKDARVLLPAMVKLQAAASGDAAWGAAVSVTVAVARNDHSSAVNLTRQLPSSLAGMAPEMQLAYLEAFKKIVDVTGISLVGYGSKQLPALFRTAGAKRATEFVAQGVGIASRYGKVAAEEFFEQRTAAAKEAAPKA